MVVYPCTIGMYARLSLCACAYENGREKECYAEMNERDDIYVSKIAKLINAESICGARCWFFGAVPHIGLCMGNTWVFRIQFFTICANFIIRYFSELTIRQQRCITVQNWLFRTLFRSYLLFKHSGQWDFFWRQLLFSRNVCTRTSPSQMASLTCFSK